MKHFIIILILAVILATFMAAAQMKPGGQTPVPSLSDAILIVGAIFGVIYLIVKFLKRFRKGETIKGIQK